MRIIKQENEKVSKCTHCGTEYAYTDYDFIGETEGSESLDTVKNFLKDFRQNKEYFSQLSQEQLKILKIHQDWVCYFEEAYHKVKCPVCGKEDFTTPKLMSIEIYPKGSIDEDGNFVESDETIYFNHFRNF